MPNGISGQVYGDLTGSIFSPQVKSISNVITGTLAVVNGGTGLTSVGTSGSALVSNGSSLVYATVSGGGGLSTVYTSGSITGSGEISNPVSLKDVISLTSVTASFSGDGLQITNLTASNITNFQNDVRNQFSSGTGIIINNGQISASSIPNSSLQNSSITINGSSISLGGTINVGDITSISAGTNMSGGGTSGDITLNLASTLTALTSVSANSFTGSLFGNASTATLATNAQTASYVATGSAIATFTNDVRNQFTAGSNITITNGIISSTSGGGGTSSVSSSGNITGSGLSGNEIRLVENINITTGSFSFNNLNSSYLINSKFAQVVGETSSLGNTGSATTSVNGLISTVNAGTQLSLNAPSIFISASSAANVNVANGTGILSVTASRVDINGDLYVNGVQITGSTGSGDVVTSGNITGSGTSGNPITLQPNISLTSVTASYFTGSGFYLNNIPNSALQNSSVTINDYPLSLGQSFNVITGSSNLTSSQVANTFTIGIKNDVTFQSVSASFFGNGSQIGNLTASNISNFTNDVRGQFAAGTNIDITNGVISSTGGGGISAVSSSGNITGSGTSGNPITLKDEISLSSVTASFSGNGSLITNLTASNINNFTNDVRNQFTAGTAITIVNGQISATGGSAVTSLTGTANQVLVNGGTAGVTGGVTLTLPQSIGTTSSPTFTNTTATTGYRLGSNNVYGLDVVNINASNRGIRLVSSSLAGALNLTGDFVGIGTINGTSGVLLSSSANLVGSAPAITFNGNITTVGNTFVNGQLTGSQLLVYNTSSLVGPTTLSNTLLAVGSATFLSNLSGTSAQFSSLTVNGVSITGSSGGGGAGSTAYDIAGIYNGKPLSSETIFRFVAVRSYDFSTTSADHYFYSAVTSSASKTFDLYRNATLIGSVSFSANNAFGTVTINSASFVAGEIFSILAPSSQDITLSDLYFTFKADTV